MQEAALCVLITRNPVVGVQGAPPGHVFGTTEHNEKKRERKKHWRDASDPGKGVRADGHELSSWQAAQKEPAESLHHI
mgnify:CR=1 FL=1